MRYVNYSFTLIFGFLLLGLFALASKLGIISTIVNLFRDLKSDAEKAKLSAQNIKEALDEERRQAAWSEAALPTRIALEDNSLIVVKEDADYVWTQAPQSIWEKILGYQPQINRVKKSKEERDRIPNIAGIQ